MARVQKPRRHTKPTAKARANHLAGAGTIEVPDSQPEGIQIESERASTPYTLRGQTS